MTHKSGARYRTNHFLSSTFVVDTHQKERCFEWEDKRRWHFKRIAQVLAVGRQNQAEIGKLICSALNAAEKAKRAANIRKSKYVQTDSRGRNIYNVPNILRQYTQSRKHLIT